MTHQAYNFKPAPQPAVRRSVPRSSTWLHGYQLSKALQAAESQACVLAECRVSIKKQLRETLLSAVGSVLFTGQQVRLPALSARGL